MAKKIEMGVEKGPPSVAVPGSGSDRKSQVRGQGPPEASSEGQRRVPGGAEPRPRDVAAGGASPSGDGGLSAVRASSAKSLLRWRCRDGPGLEGRQGKQSSACPENYPWPSPSFPGKERKRQ